MSDAVIILIAASPALFCVGWLCWVIWDATRWRRRR